MMLKLRICDFFIQRYKKKFNSDVPRLKFHENKYVGDLPMSQINTIHLCR